MSSRGKLAAVFFCVGVGAFAAQDVVSAVEGTVTKVDGATKTAVVKTGDGTEHTLHFVKRTSVHAGAEIAAGGQDAFHGLREGSTVVRTLYDERFGEDRRRGRRHR